MSQWPYRTIIEPFKIKMVEPIPFTSRRERERLLHQAGHNLFKIPANKVTLDLLTDSGTAAMSALQWSALMRGDESYACASSFFVMERAVRRIMGFAHVIPAHQGRAAERILFSMIGPGKIIPGNTHFDTTRANIEAAGSVALDLPCPESKNTSSMYPFKGNINLAALERVLKKSHAKIPLVLVTITNNAIGGQPVSLENLRQTKKLLNRYKIPLFIDAARFAENAYLIKLKEASSKSWSVRQIVHETFRLADGCLMSAKKDGFANIGGFLALNNAQWAQQARQMLVLTEGFPTYGGLAGRDLEAIAQGLWEVLDEAYLKYRIRSTEYVGEGLMKSGIPIVLPVGGHAVYIDAGRFLPHIPEDQFPGHALACALYLDAGVRTCEMGSLAFGKNAQHELVRLAIPRRVYTQSHMDWLLEAFEMLARKKNKIRGYRLIKEPKALRHFMATLAPIKSAADKKLARALAA
ncbi:MAG: tryptophanase [Elusimicrobia bacterium]|nr:tryptophanase [Elusimicrobiota bacterium]